MTNTTKNNSAFRTNVKELVGMKQRRDELLFVILEECHVQVFTDGNADKVLYLFQQLSGQTRLDKTSWSEEVKTIWNYVSWCLPVRVKSEKGSIGVDKSGIDATESHMRTKVRFSEWKKPKTQTTPKSPYRLNGSKREGGRGEVELQKDEYAFLLECLDEYRRRTSFHAVENRPHPRLIIE